MYKVFRKKQASYIVTGALNTCFAFVLFSMCIELFGESINVLVAFALISGISYVSGYFLYKQFVWNKTKISAVEFFRFIRSNLFFFSINIIMLHIFVNVLDFAPIIVQLITTGSLVVVSFLIHDTWTFSQQIESPEVTNITKVESEN